MLFTLSSGKDQKKCSLIVKSTVRKLNFTFSVAFSRCKHTFIRRRTVCLDSAELRSVGYLRCSCGILSGRVSVTSALSPSNDSAPVIAAN